MKKTKIYYYEKLDEKKITDNKKFWKTVKSLLSDRSRNNDKIHLNENGELINGESKTAELLNEFFTNIVKPKKFQSMRTLVPVLKMLKIQFLR